MELKEYLDFLDPLDIRIKGSRVGLDDVVYAFRQGATPDEIAARYPSLTLEQIFGALTYYLRHRAKVDDYVTQLDAWRQERRQTTRQNPPPVAQRLRAAQTTRQ
jgi:uncharacterized protein (DUF433 family)